MPQLDRHDEVFLLDLGDTENRFHPDWIAAVREALTRVECADGPRALVTTATGRYFSNGLDLDWVTENTDQWHSYLADVHGCSPTSCACRCRRWRRSRATPSPAAR